MEFFSKTEIFKKIDAFLKKNPNGVIEILGPTASGKTGFSIEVAKMLGGAEIISVDSRQVYRGIDISSAKILKEEMQGVPHHGLELINPDEVFSVYDFQQYAFHTIEAIQNKGNVPILCGGTMLWLDAVSENYIFLCGGRQSPFQETLPGGGKGTPKWPFLKIGIHWDRQVLYDRINARAVQQFESGLIEETKDVLAKYNISNSAFTSFGYREIKDYLDGKISYGRALELNQQRNRNYAKRQLTWWRGREDVLWVEMGE